MDLQQLPMQQVPQKRFGQSAWGWVLLAQGADLALLQHPKRGDSRTHQHLPAALQPAQTLKCYVPLLERSCFPLSGDAQLQCSSSLQSVNQQSLEACERTPAVSFFSGCMWLRCLLDCCTCLQAFRVGAMLSHKLGGKVLRCCKIGEGSAHRG